MLRAVLADLHLNSAPGDLERFEIALRAVRERGAGELVLLGDLFRTLVGFSHFWDDAVRRGLAALGALRASDVRVVLVEGNRDFFLDASELAQYFDATGTVHSFSAGGRRFLLEHGDLINRRDRAYHAWRALSKSRTARLWARLLPARVALHIVAGTEARLARTNFSYRRALPEDDLAAAARRHFDAGVDVVLWGHFHRSWRLVSGVREARVLSSWEESGAVTWIDERGTVTEERPVEGATTWRSFGE